MAARRSGPIRTAIRARGVGRRQHPRRRARRLERRARDRRGRAARSTSSRDARRPAGGRSPTGCATSLFYVVPRISPDGAECVLRDRPLAALGAARRARRARPAALDPRRHRRRRPRARDARRAIRAASSSRRASSPACSSSARSRTTARSTSSIPRAHRALRRQAHPVAVLPRRQPDRPQPQLPVVVGAARTSRSAPARSPRASPRRAASSSSRPRIPRSSRGCDLHTFGGVLIRPLGHAPDRRWTRRTSRVFRQLEAWMTEHTGYPTVSRLRGVPLRARQAAAAATSPTTPTTSAARSPTSIELWDLFKRARHGRARRSSSQYYERVSRATTSSSSRGGTATRTSGRCVPAVAPVRASAARRASRSAASIRASGSGTRRSTSSPTVCASQSRRCSCASPRSHRASRVAAIDRHDARRRPHARRRRGRERRLPRSYGVPSAKALDFNEPLYATARADGCELVDPGRRAPDARPPRRLGPRPAHRREPPAYPGHARHDERRVGELPRARHAARSTSRIGCAPRRLRLDDDVDGLVARGGGPAPVTDARVVEAHAARNRAISAAASFDLAASITDGVRA